MRKAVLIVLLAVVGTSVVAGWVETARVETITSYSDLDSIRKTGNMVKMWSLYDLKTPWVDESGRSVLSLMGQEEYDCKEKQVRTLVERHFAGNMGRGGSFDGVNHHAKWEPIGPGTGGEAAWQVACRGNCDPKSLWCKALGKVFEILPTWLVEWF